MDKEKEPIVPGMKPSQEDIAQRQKQLAARRAAAQRAATTKPRAAQAAVVAQPQKQTLAISALLIALAMGGLAAFSFMQLQQVQQKLGNAEAIIRDQAENLKVLNEKLSVTGENANLSVDALKAIVKDNAGEIRKLWDVSNKRNKANIASNGKAITTVKGQLSSLQKELKSGLAAQQKSVAAAEKKLSEKDQLLAGRLARVEKDAASIPAENQIRISQNTENLQLLEASVQKLRNGGDVGDMKLEIEDIQIRLDRIQNALGGTTP